MAARYARISCPSCGGTLDVSRRTEGEPIVCSYCGTAVEAPKGASSPFVISVGSSSSGTVGRLVLLILVGVGMLTAGILMFVLNTPESLSPDETAARLATPHMVPSAGDRLVEGAAYLAAVQSGAGGAYDLFVYGREDAAYRLYRIDDATRQVLWVSPPLGDDVDRRIFVTDDRHAFIVAGTRLSAVSLADGSVSWETSLVAEMLSVCETCLRVVDDRVVTLQKNGSLQAFDAVTGALAWDRRLASTPRTLPLVQDRLAVRDNRSGVVELVEPATGETLQRIAVRVELRGQLRASDPVVYSPNGRYLYALLHDGRSIALQAWDLSGPTRLGHVPLGNMRVPTDTRTVIDDETLYFGVDTTLYALDLTTAELRPFVTDRDHRMVPMAVQDDRLLLFAAPTWEARQWMVWAVDRTTGDRLWQFAPEAETLRFLNSHGDWDVHLTPDRLAVVQYLEDPDDALVFETLDPRTGVSRGRTTIAAGITNLWDVDWTDDTVWLDIGTMFIAVDTRTGEEKYRLR